MVILPPDLYSTQEGSPPGWLGDMSHTPWKLFGTPTVQGGYPLVPLNLVSPMARRASLLVPFTPR